MSRGRLKHKVPATLASELEAAKQELQQGHFEQARQRYQRILKRKPDLTAALHFLGVLEHMDGNSAKGLGLIQKAHQQDHGDYGIRKNLSNVLNDMNRSEEAELLCRELVIEHPEEPSNHSNHSVALRKLGRHAEAIAAGRQAVKLAPQNPVAWLALANALGCAGKLAQAAQAYEQVIALKPAFSPAHNSLCQVLLQIEQSGFVSRRRMTRTRRAYQRWVKAVPGHPTAGFMLDALETGHAPARMPDSAVRASFDGYAHDFDKHIRSLDYRAPELVGEMLARQLQDATTSLDILDGGCGTGLAAPLLRPHARHLAGVDLSPAMLERARASGSYDTLAEAELGTFLQAHPESFDVCALIDVLIYFGDLHAILLSAADALRPGGLLLLTVEKASRAGTHLHPTGRYSQHPQHVQAALAAAGLIVTEQAEAELRSEGHAPVIGLVVCAQKPH